MLKTCRGWLAAIRRPGRRPGRRRGWAAVVLCAVCVAGVGLVIAHHVRQKSRRQTDEQFWQVLTALAQGETAGVALLLERLAREPDRAAELKLLRAASQVLAGNDREALRELSAVPSVGAWRASTLYWTGRCVYRLQGPAAAESIFGALAAERPELPEVHRSLALIYHDLGAMEACLAELEDVARLQPDDFFAFRLMGLVYLADRQQDAQATAAYRQALERHPPPGQRAMIVREMAEALVGQRDYSQARAILAEADEDAVVLALRAECSWNLGDYEEAERALERARQRDPRERRALLLQADIYREKRSPDKAIPLLRAVLEQDPHDYPARYQLAQALRQLGQSEAADEELVRVEESRVLRETLRQHYRQAMQDPGDAESREQIAGICRRLGQHELAAVWAKAAEQCRRVALRQRP